MLRILRDLTASDPISELRQAQPRLNRARAWVVEYVALHDRTRPRTEPDTALLAGLDEPDRHALKLLREGLADNWSLAGLTTPCTGSPEGLVNRRVHG